MDVSLWVWATFACVVLAALVLDLRVGRASRRSLRAIPLRTAALWSAGWVALALLFGAAVHALYGPSAAVMYLSAYLLEKSLSIDNVFVFVLIFSELRIPPHEQRQVLSWGVLGALLLRAALIAGGVYLLHRFHWVVYPFAALILFAAVRLLFGAEKQRQAVVAACAVCNTWVARIVPISPVLHDGRFLIRQGGRLVGTPLLVALVIVETTDLVFATDSIPAVFAVTTDPFLVYTSNIFAMLGLRSLYFVLAGAVDRFRYLRFGLAAILAFVGGKMIVGKVLEVPTWVSLAVVAGALAAAVTASILIAPPRTRVSQAG